VEVVGQPPQQDERCEVVGRPRELRERLGPSLEGEERNAVADENVRLGSNRREGAGARVGEGTHSKLPEATSPG
jgi:hypothetical protein